MTDTPLLGWIYLPAAFALGALHALEPGHGKSLASAYLLAGRHTRRDAVVLGLATTFSHTAAIVVLALAGLGLQSRLNPGQIQHVSALIGAWLLIALGAWTVARTGHSLHHGHEHGQGHGHGHEHGKTFPADATEPKSLWGVALVGIGNGLLPCPGALAALLAGLASGRVLLGLATVLSYSLGLACALALMGILVVEAGRRTRVWLPSDESLRWLPLLSGVLVLGTGLWLLGRA